MKQNLVFIPTENMTDYDWLKHRLTGIGGSEVAAVMGINPYEASIGVFYDKVEQQVISKPENQYMFWGKINEDTVAKIWQYWDTDITRTMKNFYENKIVRRCRRINSIVFNPDYPYLFANLDRIINKGEQGMEGILEIKTVNGWALQKWEAGIPPYYLVQLQTYLLICELDKGELAILKDGNTLDVIPFERNDKIITNIIEITKDFWTRVESARELRAQGKPFEHLEPATDSSPAYEQFLKNRYKVKAYKKAGTDKDNENAAMYFTANKSISEFEDKKQQAKNTLLSAMKITDKDIDGKEITNLADEMDLPDYKITNYANVKGVRAFKLTQKKKVLSS